MNCGTFAHSAKVGSKREMKRKKQRYEKRNDDLPVYKYIPTIVCCGIFLFLPWFSRFRIRKLSDAAALLYENANGYHYDLVLYAKAMLFVLVGTFLLLSLIGENIFPDKIIKETPLRDKKNRVIWICLGIYSIAIILSAVFSEYREDTLLGSPEEGEGVFVLLSYIILFLAGTNFFYSKKALKLLEKTLLIVICITVFLSCVEYFYRPLFEISLVQKLLAADEYQKYVQNFVNVGYRNFVSLTFYNPNYFGGFCLLLLPFAVRPIFEQKKISYKILYGLATAGMFFCVIAAKSTASFYLALVEMAGMVILVMLEDFREKSKQRIVSGLIILLLCILGVLALSYILNKEKFLNVIHSVVFNQKSDVEEEKIRYTLTDIRIEENALILCSGETEFVVKLESGNVSFFNQTGESLEFKAEDVVTFSDEAYRAISVAFQNNIIIFELGYDAPVCFYMEGDRFYGMGHTGEKVDTVSLQDMRERFGTKFYGKFTGRGYAWVETLPILPEVMLLGKGAGCFAYYFPQNDYVGLLNTHGTCMVYINKPHNMYLQIAVNQGILGLVALLVLFWICFIRFWNTRRKYHAGEELRSIADSCFATHVAFLIYGVFNDSIVTVNPFFWMLVGVFLSVDYAIRSRGMKL